MGVQLSEIFTGELTNDTLTIEEEFGCKRVSVFNGSGTAGSVLGTRKLGGLSPSVITLETGDSFTVDAVEAAVITDLLITAPAGCTLKIVAQ